MVMACIICHIACILIPLNPVFPFSVGMVTAAPWTFFSISAMRSTRLPLLFIISPRHLYLGTSFPFSFSVLYFPFPLLTTLYLAAQNWVWHVFIMWLVTSSISCSLFLPLSTRQTSCIHFSWFHQLGLLILWLIAHFLVLCSLWCWFLCEAISPLYSRS